MQENGTELLVCCTGCQSCMPCMVKINIPGLFALYNRTATEGVEAVRAEYGVRTNVPMTASTVIAVKSSARSTSGSAF